MRALAGIALLVLAAPSFADCTLPVTVTTLPGSGYRVAWSPNANVTSYDVLVTVDAFGHVMKVATLPGTANGATLNALESNFNSRYTFRILANHANVSGDLPCTADVTITFSGLPASTFGYQVRRTVIPIVGSTAGVNGARFKTSLRLGPALSRTRGLIIFHPAGRDGSDADPSMPVIIERGETLQFDDVVAALGQSGLGSLDIAPLNYFDTLFQHVLPVEARLFNEAPTGTYGAFESSVQPADVFQAPDWTIFVPSTRFRVNIGLRTLTPAKVTFSHIRGDGGVTQKAADYNTDYVFLQAADQFFGEPVLPGDKIVISAAGPNALVIPFHTFTDNSTNDPEVFSPASPARLEFADVHVPIVTP